MAEPFNFLRAFTSLLERTEIPPRFALWCGISGLLSALGRRIWVPQGIYNIYPNYFIILVAASGQKKSTSIRAVGRLLKDLEAPPLLVSQKLSKEQLISDLSASRGGIIVADELATLINQKDYDLGLGPVLTTLWDCEDFEYKTLKRGTERVENGYLSLLGGSTPELLKNALPKDAIGGGFTSRTIFVYEDKIPPPVPWLEFDERTTQLEAQLLEYLNKLCIFEGEVHITREAREYFEDTYKVRYYDSPFRKDPNLKGYENRRHAHLFKVAMALMMAENPGMTLTRQHIVGANILLEEAETKMPLVMELITATDVGAMANTIWQYVVSCGEVDRSDLVKQFSHKLDAIEVGKVINTLVVARRIEIDLRGRKIIYKAVMDHN